jgi:hypothetical protein
MTDLQGHILSSWLFSIIPIRHIMRKKKKFNADFFFSNIIIFTVYWRALKAFCNYISHIWKVYLFIQYLILKTVKRDKCAKYSRSSKLLFPVYFCVEQFTVSSKILCPLSLLICSTLLCRHVMVVFCFTRCSPLFPFSFHKKFFILVFM